VADTIQLSPRDELTIVRSDHEVLEVEAVYTAEGSPPPPHLHPAQEERFEVLEGAMTACVGADDAREVPAGETLVIPTGTRHQMWNAGSSVARVRWETRPALRTEEWFRAIDAAIRHAGGEMPPLEVLLPLVAEYGDVFQLAPDA
jgi:quercetin dioxygenase-like cupin family protein